MVIKPPNIPVQADRSGDPDLLSLLKADLKARHGKAGNVFLGLVHRLDRPVGGVMVFGKTSKGAARLCDQIRKHTFQKIYLARVLGCPDPREGSLEHYLLKDGARNIVRVADRDTAGAKRALLDYRVESSTEGISRVRIQLHTGRPHQIRVQMAAIGCPLAGDQRYGRDHGVAGQPIALWSHEIAFMHPTRDEEMRFRSAPPW